MADENTPAPGEKHDAEPINEVTPQSYHRDSHGGYPYSGAELASDGPVVESTVSVTPVPGSPAADGVHAGLQGDAQQDVQSDAPADGEDNTGQNVLKSDARHSRDV